MVAETTTAKTKTFRFESTEVIRGAREQAPELAANAARFREEMDALMRKHRLEIHACVEKWFGAAKGLPPDPVVAFESRPPQPAPRSTRSLSGTAAGSTTTRGVPEFARNLPGMVIGDELAPIVPTTSSGRERESLPPETTGLTKTHTKSRNRRPGTVPDAFLSDRMQVQAKAKQNKLERWVYSRHFEWFSFTIIALNCIFIGLETQMNARQAQEYARRNLSQDHVDEPAVFWAFQILFCVLFVVELGLRWVCAGLRDFFFAAIDAPWNVFDVFVVGVGVLDLVLKAILRISSQASSGVLLGNIIAFRVLRIIRVIRVLKVIRVMRFFRELRMMISGILKSAKSMLWVCVVFCTMFYMFGIVFTNATTTFMTTQERRSSTHQELLESFGTLDTSVLSLFMAMSGGNDWAVYYQALLKLPSFFAYVFIFFVLLSVFVVTNVVIGIFVETTMQSNKDDREVCIEDELAVKKKHLQAMRLVFDEIKPEDSDVISLTEFEDRLQDERVRAYFSALQLDVSDARTLFSLLDYDRSAEVNLDEFIAGCYRLQGVSKNLDMKIMQQEIHALLERVYCMEDRIRIMSNHLCSKKRSTTASWTLEEAV